MDFTDSKRAQCVLWFANSRSVSHVKRKFRATFGRHSNVPSGAAIRKWFAKFLETGSIKRKKRSNVNFARDEVVVQRVIQTFAEEPHLSIRRAANLDGMPSAATIYRILKGEHFHPYKLNLFHKLRPQDHQKRFLHAESQLALTGGNPDFLMRLLFSDEAHFHVNGLVNKQDFRYWCDVNPKWSQDQPLHCQRITGPPWAIQVFSDLSSSMKTSTA
jgi:hypothetical protein